MFITRKMTLYKDMKSIEHIMFHTKCLLSCLMYECKHCSTTNLSIIIEHTEGADEFSTSKSRFTAIFHT